MNPLSVITSVLGAPDSGRIVELVTGRSPPDPEPVWAWWNLALVALGFGAIVAIGLVAAWRLRTSNFDAAERAFGALARRRKLGTGARELIRRAAAARGCAPVALLVSGEALAQAMGMAGEDEAVAGASVPGRG